MQLDIWINGEFYCAELEDDIKVIELEQWLNKSKPFGAMTESIGVVWNNETNSYHWIAGGKELTDARIMLNRINIRQATKGE